jgi:hypothetical protein
VRSLALLGATWLLAAAASAHLGAPEGRVPFVEAGELLGGFTTWGIVLFDEDGAWGRVCEEALGGPPGFVYRRADATVVIGRDDGLHTTTDGCALAPLAQTPLAERRPVLGAYPTAAPGRVFVATAHPDGQNGVYASTDDGVTFLPTALNPEDVVFSTLAVSPSGQRVFAAGTDTGPRTPAFFVSTDGGASFARSAPWPATTAFVRVVGTSRDGSHATLSLIDEATSGSTLWSYRPETNDAVLIGTFQGVASDYLDTGSAHLVIEGRQRFLRAPYGAPFEPIDAGPTRCLVRVAGDDRVWGCGQPFHNGHFLVSGDGVEWEPLLPFLAVGEKRCPEGSLGATRCAYLFEDDAAPRRDAGAANDGGVGVGPERPRDDPEGCASSGTGKGGSLFVFALASFAWRRRRALVERAGSS